MSSGPGPAALSGPPPAKRSRGRRGGLPLPRAHLWVLLLLPASLVAFGPGYFSDLGNAAAAIHVHGLSSTAWIVLLAAQSWSIHRRRRGLHAVLGTASLVLFPIYFAGFLLVFQSEAQRIVDGNPYVEIFGPGIGAITLIAMATTGWLYAQGLRHRGRVQSHARYLLATPFLFAESVFGRIFNGLIPSFAVEDLSDVRHIYDTFHLSQALAIVLAMWLWARDRRHGAAFVLVSGAMLAQSVALELFDDWAWWREMFLASTALHAPLLFGVGALVGVGIAGLAWRQGRKGVRNPPSQSRQPAAG